jgi:hypothetical protein
VPLLIGESLTADKESSELSFLTPFWPQRGQLFQVSEVRSEKSPPIFKLNDLLNDPVSGFYYREQLTKSPAPKSSDYFFVEKILSQKKINGKKHFLVKYLYYPNKFNQFIPEENLKRNQS